MRKTRKESNGADLQDSEEIFRYWVEVRDLTNGAVRSLPLSAVARTHIPRKKNEPQRPREEILRLQDGSAILEAISLDDLTAQLRQKYPDSGYERTLHRERDRDAEERRAEAMNQLIRILAEAVVRDTLNGARDVSSQDWVSDGEFLQGLLMSRRACCKCADERGSV